MECWTGVVAIAVAGLLVVAHITLSRYVANLAEHVLALQAANRQLGGLLADQWDREERSPHAPNKPMTEPTAAAGASPS
jgi:hypothetical protein